MHTSADSVCLNPQLGWKSLDQSRLAAFGAAEVVSVDQNRTHTLHQLRADPAVPSP